MVFMAKSPGLLVKRTKCASLEIKTCLMRITYKIIQIMQHKALSGVEVDLEIAGWSPDNRSEQ